MPGRKQKGKILIFFPNSSFTEVFRKLETNIRKQKLKDRSEIFDTHVQSNIDGNCMGVQWLSG